jgi:hypothetical protein
MERNLNDAMSVARNVMLNPKLCPGGGATEMVSGGAQACVSCSLIVAKG